MGPPHRGSGLQNCGECLECPHARHDVPAPNRPFSSSSARPSQRLHGLITRRQVPATADVVAYHRGGSLDGRGVNPCSWAS